MTATPILLKKNLNFCSENWLHLFSFHWVDLLPENRTKKEGGNGHAIWYKNYYVLLKVSLSREYWDELKLTRFKTVIPNPTISSQVFELA